MRRAIGISIVVAFVVSVAGCSSGPFTVEFSHPQEHGTIPFTATGDAVDESIVCESGTMQTDHLESLEGETITDEDWATTFDSAMENGGIAEMYVFQDWECDDGSGEFEVKFLNRFDFATFEFEGQQDVGTWEIGDGTGDYGSLSGSGNVILDWDNEKVLLTGEVDAG